MDNEFEFGMHMKFPSFVSLKKWITEMEKRQQQKFTLLRSKTIEAAKLKRKISDDLVYYSMHYTCKFSGDPNQTKGQNIRKRCSRKTGCPAFFKLMVSSDGKFLEMQEYNEEHQHDRSKIMKTGLRDADGASSLKDGADAEGAGSSKDDAEARILATIEDVITISALDTVDEQWSEIEKAYSNATKPAASKKLSKVVCENEDSKLTSNSSTADDDDKIRDDETHGTSAVTKEANSPELNSQEDDEQPAGKNVSVITTMNIKNMSELASHDNKSSNAAAVPRKVDKHLTVENDSIMTYTENMSVLALPDEKLSEVAEVDEFLSSDLGQIAFQSDEWSLKTSTTNDVVDKTSIINTSERSSVSIGLDNPAHQDLNTIIGNTADIRSTEKDQITSTLRDMGEPSSSRNTRSSKVELSCINTMDIESRGKNTGIDNKTKLDSLKIAPNTRSKGRPKGSTTVSAIGLPINRKPTSFAEKPDAEKIRYILSQLIDFQLIESVMNNEYKVPTAVLKKWETEPISEAIVESSVDTNMLKPYFDNDAFKKLKNLVQKRRKEDRVTCHTCGLVANTDAVFCDSCLYWSHFKCASLKKAPRTKLWFCLECRRMNDGSKRRRVQ